MRKGISTAIVVILVLLIIISLIFITFQWFLEYSPQTQWELEKTLEKEGCLKIENIDINNKKITIRNCGKVELSNFIVYLDSEPIAHYSEALDSGEIIQISYIEEIYPGDHDIQVSSDYAEAPKIFFYRPPYFEGVLYLNFNEDGGTTARDSSVYGNDGTLYNGTEICYNGYCPTWVDGKPEFGKALDFDALGDLVKVTADSSLSVYGKTAITVMAWIYPRSSGETGYGRIVSKENRVGDNQGEGYTLRMHNDGTVFAKVRHSTSTAMAYTEVVSFNDWNHVAFVYNEDENQYIKMYRNGALSISWDQQGVGSVLDDTDIDLRIGNFEDAGRTFDGIIG